MAYPKRKLSLEDIDPEFKEFIHWDTQGVIREDCGHKHLQVEVECPRCSRTRWVRVSQLRYLGRVPYCSNCAKRKNFTKPEHIREDWHPFVDFDSQQPKNGHSGPTVIEVTCPECSQTRWMLNNSLTKTAARAPADRLPWCRICGMRKGKERNLERGGGKRIDGHGYVQVLVGSLSPKDRALIKPMLERRSGKRKGTIPEHRLIMTRHLGRSLRPDEQVHYRNSDRQDNRLANLRLVTAGSHPVAPRDKIAYLSVEIEATARKLQAANIDPVSVLEGYLTEFKQLLPEDMFG